MSEALEAVWVGAGVLGVGGLFLLFLRLDASLGSDPPPFAPGPGDCSGLLWQGLQIPYGTRLPHGWGLLTRRGALPEAVHSAHKWALEGQEGREPQVPFSTLGSYW